jgi:hypothetical protein
MELAMSILRPPSPSALVAALIASVVTVACDEPTQSGKTLVGDAGLDATSAPTGGTLLIRRAGIDAPDEPGEPGWRARIEAAGQLVMDVPFGACPEDGDVVGNGCARVEGLAPGTHSVLVFLDRNANGALDGCPFPPQLGDAARADSFENLVGQAEVVLDAAGDAELEVSVDRRTCGPGDAATGLTGTLVLPESLGGPLYARFTQSTSCGPPPTEVRPPLTVSLGGSAARGRLDFSLGELLPGCFDVDVFADTDGDAHPTACDAEPAGGDRGVLRLPAVEIREGERRTLPESITLAPAACPEVLTGLQGTLGLGKALLESASNGEIAVEMLVAHPRIALTALESGELLDWPLALETVPAEAAAPFVIAGLAPGRYDAALYLDGDADQVFSPCGGLNGGVDAVFEQRMAVEVAATGLTDLGEVRLQRSPACAETDTEIRIRPDIELEEGAVGSGRPVRLELTPVDAQGERRSVLLFENHRDLDSRPAGADGAWHLAVQVRPGRYQARLFVDTDRNGVYRPCTEDPFGDRQAAMPVAVDFGVGPVVDLDAIRVPAHGCVVPDAAIGPEFVLGPGVEVTPPLFLRFEITEAGGWMEAFPRREPIPVQSLPYVQPPVKLAPGSYTLRAWLDTRADGLFEPCDAVAPDAWSATTTFTLDAQTPAVRPRVELANACPP